jgi:OOP family OmpA-OmpF porin
MQSTLEKKMKQAITSGRLSLVALLALMSSWAAAQETVVYDIGWYGGISAGQSRALIDDPRITSGLLGSGLTVTSINDSDRDTGYKLFGGYQLNPNFALEGGYYNLGKFGFTANTSPAGTLRGDIKLQGINLDAVGTLPFTQNLSGIARIGVTYGEAADTFSRTGAVTVLDPSPSKRDTNYKVGLGLQYAFTPAVALRLEAERFRVNDAVGNYGDVDLISLGLIWRIGRKVQTPVAYKPLPAPVYTPAPEPVVVAAAPVVVPSPLPAPVQVLHRISISADSDFEFDKAALSPSGTQALDRFLVDLRDMNYQTIVVRGNADRIGTEAYNMKLSVRRAEAVRDYLILTGGIAADKLVTTGVGESQPDTKPGECDDAKSSKALIKCLAPDRRVDIEVQGTR